MAPMRKAARPLVMMFEPHLDPDLLNDGAASLRATTSKYPEADTPASVRPRPAWRTRDRTGTSRHRPNRL